MFFVAMPNVRFDSQPAEQSSRGFGVEAGVGIQGGRMCAWPSRLSAHDGEGDHGGQDFAVIAAIGRDRSNHQRHALAIDQQCVFRPWFAAIDGAGARGLTAAEGTHMSRVDDRSSPGAVASRD